MYIKVLRSTVASGKRLQAGKFEEVSDSDGRFLVSTKKAEKAEKPKPKAKKAKES